MIPYDTPLQWIQYRQDVVTVRDRVKVNNRLRIGLVLGLGLGTVSAVSPQDDARTTIHVKVIKMSKTYKYSTNNHVDIKSIAY